MEGLIHEPLCIAGVYNWILKNDATVDSLEVRLTTWDLKKPRTMGEATYQLVSRISSTNSISLKISL